MSKYRRPYRRPYRPARKSNGIRFRSILLTILLFSFLAVLIAYLPIQSAPKEALNGPVYVIDGDTVVLSKKHIRLKGIDAPEMQQRCVRAETPYDCGKEARNILRARIGKSSIRCEKEGRDQYNRDLARCYLGETDLNRWMVEQGWAVSYGDYQREERDARRSRRGIWAGQFEQPSLWRKNHRDLEIEQPSGREPLLAVIGDGFTYIREHIRTFIEMILPRN
ncbi:thermonuclease family protein [Brucella anthropi]|uniref:thermonuclease family protein n=1 Tax=Brucella anthropi TaxID=529 RepID=UPI000F68B0C2|nr:thermonuclease family protein [Brucella anthropi]RRY10034.1 thermonuclease family protein [Brucella anthropi]